MGQPKYEIVRAIRQVDGGRRYLLEAPSKAQQMREALRDNPTMVDALRPSVIVDEDGDGRLRALEWPGHGEPPWSAIRAALCPHHD